MFICSYDVLHDAFIATFQLVRENTVTTVCALRRKKKQFTGIGKNRTLNKQTCLKYSGLRC